MLTEAPAPPVAEPLSLRDVRAGYGRIEVLHGIDVDVRRGQVTALLGPNGAGKTTALGVMSGLITPTSGCRHVEGRHLNRSPAEDLARIGICHIREGRSIFPNLSVADNLTVAASAGTPRERICEVAYTLFPRLKERHKQVAGTMSGGEKQMLALARGLGSDPAVLLVDELSMGLAPLVVAELYESVAEIARAGVSVLVVEQFATIGLKYSSYVYVMAHGVIGYAGPAAGALDAVHAAYLGGGS
ncbi:MAG TPA: ABC transporter ATP-binding protein [Acidimicrobiales bacterium]|nr:ABC transporter ATP-binding protein [Acidimicrobiales bacterium]